MHARIRLTVASALCLLTALLPAQQGASKPAPKPAPSPAATKPAPLPEVQDSPKATNPIDLDAPMDRELEAMRKQLVDGRVFRSHVRVTVRLKNGNRVHGVVKDGFVVERIDGMRFVGAEANEDGAGVRIYTYRGKRNYIFIAFAEMSEYRINARMNSQELAMFERKVREEDEAREKLRAQQEGTPAVPFGEGETPLEPETVDPTQPTEPEAATETPVKKPKQASVTDELQSMFSLLQDYPPAAGWNAEKCLEISRRKAVIGANPTEKEQKFVERFAEWQRACAVLGAKSEGEQAPTTGTESSDSNSRRARKNR